jgi:hypothetical protein
MSSSALPWPETWSQVAMDWKLSNQKKSFLLQNVSLRCLYTVDIPQPTTQWWQTLWTGFCTLHSLVQGVAGMPKLQAVFWIRLWAVPTTHHCTKFGRQLCRKGSHAATAAGQSAHMALWGIVRLQTAPALCWCGPVVHIELNSPGVTYQLPLPFGPSEEFPRNNSMN